MKSKKGQQLASTLKTAKKFVGWGVGSLFEALKGDVNVPLAYCVDSDATLWNSCVGAIEVSSPERLYAEGDGTVVVIFSGALGAIERAIPERFPRLNAAHLVDLALTDALYFQLENPKAQTVSADCGIVMQGSVEQETLLLLRYLKTTYAGIQLILSTWEDADCDILKAADAWIDDIVLSRKPSPGRGNRNLQIVSTHAGFEKAQTLGWSHALKVRTDLIPLSPSLFTDLFDALNQYSDRPRLFIPEAYTMKYLLYHPSDFVMFGPLDTLRAYWALPLDTDNRIEPAPEAILLDASRLLPQTECYLANHWCRRVGWHQAFTQQDSWNFYKTFFAVLPNTLFQLAWTKFPPIPPPETPAHFKDCVSHAFWLNPQPSPHDSTLPGWKQYSTTRVISLNH